MGAYTLDTGIRMMIGSCTDNAGGVVWNEVPVSVDRHPASPLGGHLMCEVSFTYADRESTVHNGTTVLACPPPSVALAVCFNRFRPQVYAAQPADVSTFSVPGAIAMIVLGAVYLQFCIVLASITCGVQLAAKKYEDVLSRAQSPRVLPTDDAL
jgi:hypothetical protein